MVWYGLYSILARDQPSRAPIDSTKIQLWKWSRIHNCLTPSLFFCQTKKRESSPLRTEIRISHGTLISRRRRAAKKSFWLLYKSLLSMYADVARASKLEHVVNFFVVVRNDPLYFVHFRSFQDSCLCLELIKFWCFRIVFWPFLLFYANFTVWWFLACFGSVAFPSRRDRYTTEL